MTKKDFNELEALLKSKPKNIIITTHVNPDGDAIGSSLGLYHVLKKAGHNALVIVPNNYPDFLKWLPGNDTVLIYESDEDICQDHFETADIIFCLDYNGLSRIDKLETPVAKSKALKVMIDHHPEPEDFVDYTYSYTKASSTAELIYQFIEECDLINHLDADSAPALYTGIMTDTGSFRFPSTSALTHRITANLIDAGANNSEIHNNIYDTSSPNRMKLLGISLDTMQVLTDYNTAYIALSDEQLKNNGFKKGDTEGFVNYCLAIEGIVFAAFFRQDNDRIKISFRSKGDFSVNKFSRNHFNGGGHTNAAGGIAYGSLKETLDKFVSLLPEYKKELTK